MAESLELAVLPRVYLIIFLAGFSGEESDVELADELADEVTARLPVVEGLAGDFRRANLTAGFFPLDLADVTVAVLGSAIFCLCTTEVFPAPLCSGVSATVSSFAVRFLLGELMSGVLCCNDTLLVWSGVSTTVIAATLRTFLGELAVVVLPVSLALILRTVLGDFATAPDFVDFTRDLAGDSGTAFLVFISETFVFFLSGTLEVLFFLSGEAFFFIGDLPASFVFFPGDFCRFVDFLTGDFGRLFGEFSFGLLVGTGESFPLGDCTEVLDIFLFSALPLTGDLDSFRFSGDFADFRLSPIPFICNLDDKLFVGDFNPRLLPDVDLAGDFESLFRSLDGDFEAFRFS